MTDALEELKKALDMYTYRRLNSGIFDNALWDSDDKTLGRFTVRHLPALLAELEQRRAAMGDDGQRGDDAKAVGASKR